MSHIYCYLPLKTNISHIHCYFSLKTNTSHIHCYHLLRNAHFKIVSTHLNVWFLFSNSPAGLYSIKSWFWFEKQKCWCLVPDWAPQMNFLYHFITKVSFCNTWLQLLIFIILLMMIESFFFSLCKFLNVQIFDDAFQIFEVFKFNKLKTIELKHQNYRIFCI